MEAQYLFGGGTVHSDVFDNIISCENLLKAWCEFKKGKTKKKDIQEFDFNLEENIFSLHKELQNKTYINKPYVPFYVYDPKKRHIHKAEVRDRVVHQAIYRVLYGIYDKHFIYDSYSCRNKKGTHKGVKRLEEFTRKESKNYSKDIWILKCDISKYFDSIDHDILRDILFKENLDDNTKWLLAQIIDSFHKNTYIRDSVYMKNDKNKTYNSIYAIAEIDYCIKPLGLPLGNVTSQLFANIYLNEFDQFVKHKLKVKYYIRYCDDFVFVFKDRKYLELLIPQIASYLKNGLSLNLHPRKVEIRKLSQGIDFLGYVTLSHYRVLRTKTKKRILKKFRKGIKEEAKQSYLGILSHCKGYKIQKQLNISHN